MLNQLGTCPVCNKGSMLEYEYKIQCNYFKGDHFCNFTIWKEYFKKEISSDNISTLILGKETEIIPDFLNSNGKTFSASLFIDNGTVVPKFKNIPLNDCNCANCGGVIYKISKGYACENFYKNTCAMIVYNTYAGVKIKDDVAKVLVNGNTTDFIDGFVSQKGTPFSAKLFINDQTFKVVFDYKIGNCPKCHTGEIFKKDKFFGCSNFFNEVKCDFIIWTSILGYNLSFDDVSILISGNETSEIKFNWNGKESYGKLKLDDQFKCKVI